MAVVEDRIEAISDVKIFKLVSGDTVIAVVDGSLLLAPFNIVVVDNQGNIGFNPYCSFGESFDSVDMFMDNHIVSQYKADETLVKDFYKPMALETLSKIKAKRAGIILDSNVPKAAGNVSNINKLIKK